MNEIVNIVAANPVMVLTDEVAYSEFYKTMKAEVSAHVPDTSTDKGRKEIAALAYKVTRTKTAIDAAGKKLNEDARAKINVVDASRRRIRDELDALADEARKPLTVWEDAEKARTDAVDAWHRDVGALAQVSTDDGSNLIGDRLAAVEAMAIDPAVMMDGTDSANHAKQSALSRLRELFNVAVQREKDRAELARLRAEQEERERQEREAHETAERERIAKENAERAAAEQKAREERAAEAARLAEQRRAQEAIDTAKRDADAAVAKAEAEAKAIREKAEREDRERKELAERTAREEAARQSDREHRGKIMGEAKAALIALDLAEEQAKRVVLAIVANEVPHVSLRF